MKNTDFWDAGYFCAVAKLIEREGEVTPLAKEIFHAGGNWSSANTQDIATFRRYGLIEESKD